MSRPWASIDLAPGVRAIQTNRGIGPQPYGGFNLGVHVGDDTDAVLANRQRLAETFGVVPVFANQVHGIAVAEVHTLTDPIGDADALVVRNPRVPIGVLTADCLPVIFSGNGVVAVAHAGWRGLAGGVLEAVLPYLGSPEGIRAWLGPCIGRDAFEVGPEVRDTFVGKSFELAQFFTPSGRPQYVYADLSAIARHLLKAHGVRAIQASNACTFGDTGQWYSFRREGVTGRMATCIMITE
jgi:polyphenol oxidase